MKFLQLKLFLFFTKAGFRLNTVKINTDVTLLFWMILSSARSIWSWLLLYWIWHFTLADLCHIVNINTSITASVTLTSPLLPFSPWLPGCPLVPGGPGGPENTYVNKLLCLINFRKYFITLCAMMHLITPEVLFLHYYCCSGTISCID